MPLGDCISPPNTVLKRRIFNEKRLFTATYRWQNPIHQFEIKPLVPIELGGLDLSYTNSALWMTIGAVVSIAFLMMASGKKSLVPGRLQAVGELMYSFIASMVKDNIGVKGKQYFPFIFTLFMFVLMGNMLGLLPYSFTYTKPFGCDGFIGCFWFL